MRGYIENLTTHVKPPDRNAPALSGKIKQNIPFDSLTMQEELALELKLKKRKESIAVKVNGRVSGYTVRELLPQQTTIVYGGEELLIRGEGFNRYIQL